MVASKLTCTVVKSGPLMATFDLAGRLLYATDRGTHLKRGLDGTVVRIAPDGPPERLAAAEARRLTGEVCDRARLAGPDVRSALDGAERRMDRDAAAFESVYGRIPVLPPDQYDAVYLQATVGCAWNRCSFCTLYHGVRYRPRTVPEFQEHLHRVLTLLGPAVGRHHRIFLGDADALAVPARDLIAMMRIASSARPNSTFACFADATLHARLRLDELRALRDWGLARVTIGLETACRPLYETLRKPCSLEDVAQSVRLAKLAGLDVGLPVVVGLGGEYYGLRHVVDTVAFIERLPLGAGDYVYLSPLRFSEPSAYAAWAGRERERAMSDAQVREQEAGFRRRLARLQRAGVRVAAYDIARFVYS